MEKFSERISNSTSSGFCYEAKFAEVFKSAWENVTTVESAIKGFKKSGLYPVNRENIDNTKLEPSFVFQISSVSTVSSPLTTETITDIPVVASQDATKTNDDNPVVSNQDAQAESSMNTSVETIVTDTSVDTIMTDILVERQDTSTTNKTNGIIAYENTNVQNENTETRRLDSSDGALHLSLSPVSRSLSADKENETQNPGKFSAILTIPQNTKVKPNHPKLPKAISGKEMVKFLEDRKNKKEEEARLKEVRKAERESQKRKKCYCKNRDGKKEWKRNEIRI
jgi:hypothetical protein